MPESEYQERSARIIARVLAAYPDADEKTLRERLRHNYPFRTKSGDAYRCWCDELRSALDARFRQVQAEHWAKKKQDEQEAAGQLRLLE